MLCKGKNTPYILTRAVPAGIVMYSCARKLVLKARMQEREDQCLDSLHLWTTTSSFPREISQKQSHFQMEGLQYIQDKAYIQDMNEEYLPLLSVLETRTASYTQMHTIVAWWLIRSKEKPPQAGEASCNKAVGARGNPLLAYCKEVPMLFPVWGACFLGESSRARKQQVGKVLSMHPSGFHWGYKSAPCFSFSFAGAVQDAEPYLYLGSALWTTLAKSRLKPEVDSLGTGVTRCLWWHLSTLLPSRNGLFPVPNWP